MNTKATGERSEAMVIAALLKAGKVVLQPFGDNQRYDLVVEEDGKFLRLQVKTGRLKKGAISFKSCSTYAHRGRSSRCYRGEADLFAVYYPGNDKIYMVPVNSVGKAEVSLRLEQPKIKRNVGIRVASDFEFNSRVVSK